MKIFIEEGPAVPMVHLAVAFEGGTVDDPAGKEGLATVTGRMLRRGTVGIGDVDPQIDRIGADFGAFVNFHATALYFGVIRRSLNPGVDLLAKMIGQPTFEAGALARLLREMDAEVVEAQDNDDWLAMREARRALFGTHPYGTIPTRASLRTITRDDVVACHSHLYDEVEAVGLAGDITVSEAASIAQRLEKPRAVGALVRRARVQVEDPLACAGRRLVFIDKPDRTQNPILIAALGTHPLDRDFFPLLVANTAFGGTFNSRLMEEVRAKRGWSYGANASLGVDRNRQAWSLSVTPKTSDAPNCLALVMEMLEQFRRDGLTAVELDRVKRYLARSHAFQVETAAQRLRRRLECFLNQAPEDHITRFVEQVEAVTLDEANAAVRQRLSDSHLVVAVVGTHAEHGAGIAKAIRGLEGETVVPFDAD